MGKVKATRGFSVFSPFTLLLYRARVLVLVSVSQGLALELETVSFDGQKRGSKMDSFSTESIGTGSSQMSTSDFMDQMKLQLAQAYAQEFLETVRGKCFDKCISKPGSSLSGSESSCISRCVDRYIEATGIVSRALFNTPR